MTHIALICAMPQEIAAFQDLLVEFDHKERTGTMRFWHSAYQGKTLTVVLAGIGKVHAAAAAQLVIERYAPDAVFSCGTAGALDSQCKIGDLIIGAATIQHDYGFVLPETVLHYGIHVGKPQGKRRYIKEFPAAPELLRLAETCQHAWQEGQCFFGSILTGDQVIFSTEKRHQLAAQFQAFAVDMESAAIAQVCLMRGVPFLSIRGISDHADETFPVDISHLDLHELQTFSFHSFRKNVSVLTQAINYFVHHPSAFVFSVQARQHIHTAADHSAQFTLSLLENL